MATGWGDVDEVICAPSSPYTNESQPKVTWSDNESAYNSLLYDGEPHRPRMTPNSKDRPYVDYITVETGNRTQIRLVQRQDHPIWRLLEDKRLRMQLYRDLLAVDPNEPALLCRLMATCTDFRTVFEPVLYSAVVLASTRAYDRLFETYALPTRGPLLLAHLSALCMVNVEVKLATRFLFLAGHQLVDLQLAVSSHLEPLTDKERSRLVAGLAKCPRLSKLALRGDGVTPTALATLVAIWSKLAYLDLEQLLPNFAAAGIKPALLPRLRHIVLHQPPGGSALETFLRPFSSALETLELHSYAGELPIQDFFFKRLRSVTIHADGGIRPVEVKAVLERGRLPVLKTVVVLGGLDRWRGVDGSLGGLTSETTKRGISLVSVA